MALWALLLPSIHLLPLFFINSTRKILIPLSRNFHCCVSVTSPSLLILGMLLKATHSTNVFTSRRETVCYEAKQRTSRRSVCWQLYSVYGMDSQQWVAPTPLKPTFIWGTMEIEEQIHVQKERNRCQPKSWVRRPWFWFFLN